MLEHTVVTLEATAHFSFFIFWEAAQLCFSDHIAFDSNAAGQTGHLSEYLILTFVLEAHEDFPLQNTFPRTGEYCVEWVLVFPHLSE